MIDQERINILLAEGLKKASGCEVVKSNMTKAPIPRYPYISFTVLNTDTKRGTYSAGDGVWFTPLTQTWSLTVQSDQDQDAQLAAMKVKDWLEAEGKIWLNDHDIVVQKIGPVTNRDTLLTLEYEYRKGFDMVLSLVSRVDDSSLETIERAEIKKE